MPECLPPKPSTSPPIHWLFPSNSKLHAIASSISNYGEGLRPWQPKKIYYGSDAIHFEFFKGNGPEYATSDHLLPARKPYSRVAAEAWGYYKTQNDFSDAQLKEFTEMPVRFIFGKSLVGGNAGSDIFDGITPTPIPYARPRGYERQPSGLALELGGPWAFYHTFWPAHGLEHLAKLFSPEAQVTPGESLWVPLIIRNDTRYRKAGHAALHAPGGLEPKSASYRVSGGRPRFLCHSTHHQQFSHAEGKLANTKLDSRQRRPKPGDGDPKSRRSLKRLTAIVLVARSCVAPDALVRGYLRSTQCGPHGHCATAASS